MEKAIKQIKNCILEILNYIIMVMILRAVFSLFPSETPHFITYSLFAAVPLFFYFIRVKILSIWLFTLFHILTLILVYIIFNDSIVQRIAFLILTLLYVIYSTYIKIAVYTNPLQLDYNIKNISPIITVVIATFSYLITNNNSTIIIIIVLIVLHLIYHYLSSFLHYININRRSAGSMPLKEIITIDFPLITGFTLLTALAMAAVAGRNIIAGIAEGLIETLRRFLRRLPINTHSEIETEVNDPIRLPSSPIPDEIYRHYPPRTEIFFQILNNLITIISTIIIIALTILIIGLIIAQIKAAFARRTPKAKEQPEDQPIDIIEKLKRIKQQKPTAKRRLFRTPDEKIRRIFVNTITKKAAETPDNIKAKTLLTSGTVREMATLFPPHKDPQTLPNFITLYEKARYAQQTCTPKDVKQAKHLSNLLTKP